MATNVTEKDKTLRAIIDFCEALALKIKGSEDVTTDLTYGKLRALWLVEKQCLDMLGYSGSMPTEVPNQIEDAK